MAAQNALERLAEFPNMMNWRGTWLVTDQYLQNDVVVSPANGASYILQDTAQLNGADPSANPAWTELAPAATGISEITAGAGITVTDPTGPVTTIVNDGVLSLISGANISIDNTDPKNPIVNSTALTSVQPGLGIAIGGLSFSPTITNTGVRTLAVGAGLTTNADPNNPSLGTTAVLSISQGNGILVTGGQTATVTNNGVRTISGTGNGITVNNSDPKNPIISSTGVLSVTAGASVTVTGTPTNPIVSARVPQVTQVGTAFSITPLTNWPVAPASIGVITVLPMPADIFYTYINSGPPDVTGIFVIDLTSINLFATGSTPAVAGDKISVFLIDPTTTAPTPITYLIGDIEINVASNSYPFQLRPSLYAFNVTALRATGFRIPIQIGFLNNTTAATLEINNWGDIFATYYPVGLQ